MSVFGENLEIDDATYGGHPKVHIVAMVFPVCLFIPRNMEVLGIYNEKSDKSLTSSLFEEISWQCGNFVSSNRT